MKMDGLRLIGGVGNDAFGIANGPTVDLPLPSVNAPGPFVLKAAEGLGPPETGLRIQRSTLDVGSYRGRTPALRQVTMLVNLNPSWYDGQTAEELRTMLYSMLTTRYDQPVRMEVMYQGDVQAYAQGYVARMEPSYFTKDPAVQIVLECDTTYLMHPEILTVTPTIRPFEGPVAGVPWRTFELMNEGTAPAHFSVGIKFITPPATDTMLIADEALSGSRIMISGLTWNSGDTLLIDTHPGVRNLWRIPNGSSVQTSILNNLTREGSAWMQLHYGLNAIMVTSASYTFSTAFPFRYRPNYWGV